MGVRRARGGQRPVFLAVGSSAGHWCHGRANESFENVETARWLNEHFISIKIDREERPDVDRVYMAYVQALTGHGGWPLVHAGPFDLDREAIARGLVERIATHLDAMGERRAWAFLMHDALGYDLSEIADMTGDSVAAVQSRLSRGRRDLHARIARGPELAELRRVGVAGG